MDILFSMDGIKDLDCLYTWTVEQSDEFGEGQVEHYHGDDYCKTVICDALESLSSSDWPKQEYFSSHAQVGNETFELTSIGGNNYIVSFSIYTYNRKAARLEVAITAPNVVGYDQRLEELKITLKDRLISDWQECTWLVDEQSVGLCKEAYEKAYVIENKLRAFASKVLIHFLGVNWIRMSGLEKEADSVKILKEKFTQRIPEFDNINADFLSMTLETLSKVLFTGEIFKEDIVLNREDYAKVQRMAAKQNVTGISVADYIKSRRVVDKKIWEDLVQPYIDKPNSFKTAAHAFIEDRNHIAHSKVLTRSAYQVMLRDFEVMDGFISSAICKFDREETSDEMIQTWDAEHEDDEYERDYYRDRLASETGMDILNEREIEAWFDTVLHELYNEVYQRYHLDVCYDISDFSELADGAILFSILCPAVEDGSAKICIFVEYSIDDDLGEYSTCCIVAKNGNEEEILKTEVRFHNGDGYEGEEGIMEATENTEYDISELDDFKDQLFDAIEKLNPYSAQLDELVYQSKGAEQFIADFACEQCGKAGVSINENFLKIGRCCYCGYENELSTCERCGELLSVYELENGFCPSCISYIEKQ